MQPKTFILQLHYMLSDSLLSPWIRWSQDDHIFCLKPYDPEFSGRVLKKNFKHGNVSSFVRQLHMYGFHKLQNGPAINAQVGAAAGHSIENQPPTHIIKSNKESMVWYFTHPSGYFYKNASQADLARIQRTSNGVGKDGKRKNGLSPVCVSILDANARSNTSPVNAAAPVRQLDTMHRYPSIPQAFPPASDSFLQAPVVQEQQQSQSTYSHPNIPKHNSSSSLDLLSHQPQHQQPLSMAAAPLGSQVRHCYLTPGINTALRSPLIGVHQQQQHQQAPPIVSNQGIYLPPTTSASEYVQYESNLQLLQRSMLTIVDILQLSPTRQDSANNLQNLNHLKTEILSMDNRWNSLRFHPVCGSSNHSSLSSETSNSINQSAHQPATATSIASMPGQPATEPRISKTSNNMNPNLIHIATENASNNLSSNGAIPQYPNFQPHHQQHKTKVPLSVFPPIQQQAQYPMYLHPQHHTHHLRTQSQG
ncbi:HGR080Wp [Eremothecium sinecaudum]|uniref:HGR080Wp n=1 Tax=Eremothecium sinecaudum TaxID=45286 RepID=A0A0X8HVY1_9SACH|nr:HGR080Wp [Eremothecium sinecaudum]AMD22419.1 HGR080Wp [Eremothecium sinecaudum]